MLSPKYFGGQGNPDLGFCITEGVGAFWMRKFPEFQCVRRQFAPGPDVGAWHSPEWVTHILQTSYTYDEFRQNLESSLHSRMHTNIGGMVGDLDMMPPAPQE